MTKTEALAKALGKNTAELASMGLTEATVDELLTNAAWDEMRVSAQDLKEAQIFYEQKAAELQKAKEALEESAPGLGTYSIIAGGGLVVGAAITAGVMYYVMKPATM
jgi:hypothetical protein